MSRGQKKQLKEECLRSEFSHATLDYILEV